jgi:hypothetical protein
MKHAAVPRLRGRYGIEAQSGRGMSGVFVALNELVRRHVIDTGWTRTKRKPVRRSTGTNTM